MRRVLLFGASGFLGARVRAALAPHAELTCPGRAACDLLTAGPDEVAGLIRAAAPDAVVSCAGALGGTPTHLVRANTLATATLLEAIGQAAPGARFVRIGSAGEYGPVPRGAAVSEDDDTRPVGPYGVSHLAATRLVALAAAAGQVDGVALRVFNPIGPGLSAENVLGRAAQLLRRALAAGDDHIALGPLDAYRDFVDVRDVAAAVAAAVLVPAVPRAVYNVGSGSAVCTRDAVRQLSVIAGFPGAVREAAPVAAAARSAGVPWIRADVSAAARDLGWRPRHVLADTLAALWAAADPGPEQAVPRPAAAGFEEKEPACIRESASWGSATSA
ncbi:NAD-dependent epimerase/dehydratase family protein [Jidongwangia harbinensis]|uniref:NAD-dependent epimerase/dehydratase family protein n=1 Tax=Jidongwangia harbinensis TaxID=2878561 RepID=UPI001CDA0C30|nr:NAD-dependent epimerase/dehydratase family protein [Jidongwangia harbinensis]MCA2214072.1 NAD-dependent epimerase/dehydratase family protein [Jidongwangia harbinensis]